MASEKYLAAFEGERQSPPCHSEEAWHVSHVQGEGSDKAMNGEQSEQRPSEKKTRKNSYLLSIIILIALSSLNLKHLLRS